MDEDEETRPSCNCKKNEGLKCYCHCFSGEWFCSDDCKCEGCWNRVNRRILVEEHAELRLNTKPCAPPRSNISVHGDASSSSGHVKGCTCKKSGCKKNYCECFKNKVACTVMCKCQGCENTHGTGGSRLQENGDSDRSSGKSSITSNGSDGSPGGSNGSAAVTDEELLRPTEGGEHYGNC